LTQSDNYYLPRAIVFEETALDHEHLGVREREHLPC